MLLITDSTSQHPLCRRHSREGGLGLCVVSAETRHLRAKGLCQGKNRSQQGETLTIYTYFLVTFVKTLKTPIETSQSSELSDMPWPKSRPEKYTIATDNSYQ